MIQDRRFVTPVTLVTLLLNHIFCGVAGSPLIPGGVDQGLSFTAVSAPAPNYVKIVDLADPELVVVFTRVVKLQLFFEVGLDAVEIVYRPVSGLR